jgi:hypothetical protein
MTHTPVILLQIGCCRCTDAGCQAVAGGQDGSGASGVPEAAGSGAGGRAAGGTHRNRLDPQPRRPQHRDRKLQVLSSAVQQSGYVTHCECRAGHES